MSFQKAHQISNELGEVVVQSAIKTLSNGDPISLDFPPVFKNYRVLELGFVVINDTASSNLTLEFGTSATGSEFISLTSAITIAANSSGTKFSTAVGTFDFNAAGTGAIDSDGVPELTSGQQVHVDVNTPASAGTEAVFFARLAPNIEYKG
ncbi:MAG: hypothetical protein VW270_17790 [Candidatus Poseidoniales archaeon]